MKYGDYRDWKLIDYMPATGDMVPECLVQYIKGNERVLDVGSHHGDAARFLAERGLQVLGIDINSDAVKYACDHTYSDLLNRNLRFQVADLFDDAILSQKYEIVLLNRFLTCMPKYENWKRALKGVSDMLCNGGIIYINDFLLMPDYVQNRNRYMSALRDGLRWGNLVVNADQGKPWFIAHHHSEKDLEVITKPYLPLLYRRYATSSRSGYLSSMFEFAGRKP